MKGTDAPQLRKPHKYSLEDVPQSVPRSMNRNTSWHHMALEGPDEKCGDMRKDVRIGTISIVVKQGDITKEQACALVNIIPPSRDMSKETGISQSFVRAGGQELVQMYQDKVQSEEDGFVVTQGAGNLKCDIVLHVMLRTRVNDTEREVRKVMRTCFQKCQMYGVKTLALPPLGCGRFHGYDQDSVVKSMLDETSKLALGAHRQMRIRKVIIVVYDKDICQMFLEKLSSLETQSTESHSLYRRDGGKISLPHSESSPAMFHLYDQQQHSDQERETGPRNAIQPRTTKKSTFALEIVAKDKQSCLDSANGLNQEMKEKCQFESESVDKQKKGDLLSEHNTSVKQRQVTRDVQKDYFLRIVSLLVDVGPKVLRQLLLYHIITPIQTLDQYFKSHKQDIYDLRKKRILKKDHYYIIFPQNGGGTDIRKYDITLLSALLNNIISSIGDQEKQKVMDLRDIRNNLFHAGSAKLDMNDLQTISEMVTTTLTDLSKLCQDAAFEDEIQREIQDTQQSQTSDIVSRLAVLEEQVKKLSSEIDNLQRRVQ